MAEQGVRTPIIRCALDASKKEAFTQKAFIDLITESHTLGNDYYVARVRCLDNDDSPLYFCYDAKHLCKHVFEMAISTEGRKIRIKNFKDPVNGMEIEDVHFFKLRSEGTVPMRAEYVGNHTSFLESGMFRSKMFGPEDNLSVNFQFKKVEKLPKIKRKRLLDVVLLFMVLMLLGVLGFMGVKSGKDRIVNYKYPTTVPTKLN